jgi:hypothetical protein
MDTVRTKTDLSAKLFLLAAIVIAHYWTCNSVTRNVECCPEVRKFLLIVSQEL